MTFGLEKGQCSQADLNKSLKMVPKLLNPMFKVSSQCGGGGGEMMFCLEPYVLCEQSGGRGWWGMTFGLKKGQCSQADLNQSQWGGGGGGEK